MPNQDDIDTAPVILRDDTNVTFESIELAPGDRAEIVLSPKRPVANAVLFVSSTQRDSAVVIEQVLHGGIAIFGEDRLTIEQLKYGKKIDFIVTESEPLAVVVSNPSPLKTTVGASLVTNEPESKTAYQLRDDEIVQDEE